MDACGIGCQHPGGDSGWVPAECPHRLVRSQPVKPDLALQSSDVGEITLDLGHQAGPVGRAQHKEIDPTAWRSRADLDLGRDHPAKPTQIPGETGHERGMHKVALQTTVLEVQILNRDLSPQSERRGDLASTTMSRSSTAPLSNRDTRGWDVPARRASSRWDQPISSRASRTRRATRREMSGSSRASSWRIG